MTTAPVKRAYKYRFYPDDQQRDMLLRTFGCCRLVWNRMLEARTSAWHQERRSISYVESSAMLTAWKKTDELVFLNEVSSIPLQQTLRHLQGAFGKFWSKQNNYPRFKSKKKSRASAEFTRSAFRYRDGQVFLAKCERPLDIHWSRPLPVGAEPSSITVSCDRAGRWFCSILVEEQITLLPKSDGEIGIDLGTKHLAILSNGEKIDHPRFGKRDGARLAREQRKLSRKQAPRCAKDGQPAQAASKNYLKQQLKVARIAARTADCRRDYLHKLSTRLIRENQTIVIEDLNTAGMTRRCALRPNPDRPGKWLPNGQVAKRGQNRSVRDAGWRELRSMLEYKAAWYGREVVVIDRWFPSSQLCSDCGIQSGPKGRKDLKVRRWTCSACGATHDRDVNAAINVLAAGRAASVCGDGRSRRGVAA